MIRPAVSARELFQKKLDAGLDDPETVSLTAAARAAETVEKVYSHSDEGIESDARSFADRLKWLDRVVRELQTRGEPVTVDGVVIDAEPEAPGASEN